MARRGPCLLLPPVLLVLLASGCGVLTAVPEELHAVLGQTLSVRCRYTPQMGPYVRKSWCRQTSVGKCTRLVTTSRPRTAVTELRHAIWDDPQAGFFVINTTDLKEDDSGPYWCGNYNASENTIFILRNITLVVSSALLTTSTWTTAWLSATTVLVTSPVGTSGISTNGSEHRNSTSVSSLDAASPELLLFLQCGLLALKGLLLSALCVVLCCRRCCRGHENTMATEMIGVSDYTSFVQAPEPWGAFGRVPGHRRNTYSPAPTADTAAL